jgi:hypothetical protein
MCQAMKRNAGAVERTQTAVTVETTRGRLCDGDKAIIESRSLYSDVRFTTTLYGLTQRRLAELMSMGHWRNDTDGANPKCWEKELPH